MTTRRTTDECANYQNLRPLWKEYLMNVVEWIRRTILRPRTPDEVLDEIAKRNADDIALSGYVRGWHRGCPASERPMLGTYALVPNGTGGVMCEACGAHDLVARAEAESALTHFLGENDHG